MRGAGIGNKTVTAYEEALYEKPDINPEDITSVKFKNGKISYVRGNKRTRKKQLKLPIEKML